MTAPAIPTRTASGFAPLALWAVAGFELLLLLLGLALLELVLCATLSNSEVAVAAYRYLGRPERVGFFAYHAAGLLALGVIIEQLIRLGASPRLRGAAMWAIGLGVLLPSAAAAYVALQLRPIIDFARAQAALQLGLVLLLFGVALAAGTLRVRIGLALVTLPYLLESLAVLAAGNPKLLALAGGWAQSLWPLAGFAVFFCFDPVSPSGGRTSCSAFASARLGVAVVALVVAMLIARRPNELQIFTSLTRGLFGLSVTRDKALVFLAVWLLAGTGAMTLWFVGASARRVAYGVVLLIVAGLKAPVGLYSLLLIAGLVTVFSGVLEMSAAPRPGQSLDRPFELLVETLRALVGGPSAELARITVGEVGREVVQLRGQAGERQARLRMVKAGTWLVELELILGEPSPRESDLKLSSGTEPDDDTRSGKRWTVGDGDFDRLFTARLRRAEGTDAVAVVRARELLLDPAPRERIRAGLRGTLTLWSGQALRYRALPGTNCELSDLGLGPVLVGHVGVRGAQLERLVSELGELARHAGVPVLPALPAPLSPAAVTEPAPVVAAEPVPVFATASEGPVAAADVLVAVAEGPVAVADASVVAVAEPVAAAEPAPAAGLAEPAVPSEPVTLGAAKA